MIYKHPESEGRRRVTASDVKLNRIHSADTFPDFQSAREAKARAALPERSHDTNPDEPVSARTTRTRSATHNAFPSNPLPEIDPAVAKAWAARQKP